MIINVLNEYTKQEQDEWYELLSRWYMFLAGIQVNAKFEFPSNAPRWQMPITGFNEYMESCLKMDNAGALTEKHTSGLYDINWINFYLKLISIEERKKVLKLNDDMEKLLLKYHMGDDVVSILSSVPLRKKLKKEDYNVNVTYVRSSTILSWANNPDYITRWLDKRGIYHIRIYQPATDSWNIFIRDIPKNGGIDFALRAHLNSRILPTDKFNKIQAEHHFGWTQIKLKDFIPAQDYPASDFIFELFLSLSQGKKYINDPNLPSQKTIHSIIQLFDITTSFKGEYVIVYDSYINNRQQFEKFASIWVENPNDAALLKLLT